MRWKELLIGAVLTLAVTVAGGVVVYYFTQPEPVQKEELLTFQVEQQVAFEGKDNSVSIGSLRFGNIGSAPARDVVAQFSVKTAEIIEFQAVSQTNAEVSSQVSEDKHTVSVRVKTLLPEEIVTATFLLSEEAPAELNLRSSSSIGKEGATRRTIANDNSEVSDFLVKFLPLLVLFAIFPAIYALPVLARSSSRSSCRNNTGFVLLHSGATDEAIRILRSAVEAGEDGSHALANLATAIALSGDAESSHAYLEAAEFLASTKHEKAVCALSRSIIEHQFANENDARESFSSALALSKSEVKSYAQKSKLLQGILESDTEFKQLLENA